MADLIRENDDWIAASLCGTAVSWWASQFPDRVAIVSVSGTQTFAQLDTRANGLAQALRQRGLRAGDAVALMCGNRAEFIEVWAACQRAGLRLTPINWHLTAAEAAYIVENCGAKAFVAEAVLGAVVAQVNVPAAANRIAIGGELPGFENYEQVMTTASPEPLADPSLGSVMLYTSGTTGRPKGVHRPPVSDIATGVHKAYAYCHGDVHLCTGPLYHAAPLTISMALPLNCGVTVVLMERWDPQQALALVAEWRVTHTHMVPTMFHRMLGIPAHERAAYDLNSLKALVHGAAPCPVHVKRAMIEWLGPIVFEYYAATEGAGTVVDSHTWLKRPGTVGKPMPAGQVMVGNEEAEPLPAGQVGLVWLRAAVTSRFEYFKDEEKTAGSYRGDYFTLGDLGYMDDDGFLFLTDRSANLIISGGVNIYPAEVDAVLLEHPSVADAATIGVPNEEWGEEVKAVVELRGGVTPSEELADELIQLCRSKLAHYKCPRSVDFTAALPRQENGKIYKRLLRDQYRAPAPGS